MGGLRSLRRSVMKKDVKEDSTTLDMSFQDKVKATAMGLMAKEKIPIPLMNRRVRQTYMNMARRQVMNRKVGS